jgi:hypothetical protein
MLEEWPAVATLAASFIPTIGNLDWTVFKLLRELHVVVAGNTEKVADTRLIQPTKQDITNRVFHCHLLAIVSNPACRLPRRFAD